MSKKIYFDLDGTLYDLYSIPNWLEKIESEQSGLFLEGETLFEPAPFYKLVSELFSIGYEFGVITWLPMGASPEYEEICRAEKLQWIHENLPFVSEINVISYGIPKQKAIQKRASKMYLIDDSKEVCEEWMYNTKMQTAVLLTDCVKVIDALKKIMEEN